MSRAAYAHDAVVALDSGGDPRAPGGAITVALCGHWDHEPPCPLAPHHTDATHGGDDTLRLRVLFAADPLEIAANPFFRIKLALLLVAGGNMLAFQLIGRRTSIQGWPAGVAVDSEDTLSFSALGEVRPMVETFPLEQAAAAYDRMMSGAARFRAVLTMGD